MALDPGGGDESGLSRATLLDRVARLVPSGCADDCVLVAVDGVDGSGKTTFADELAAVLTASGRHTLRISVDDFHHVRDHRYRLGRDSPEGFWLDSFNYERVELIEAWAFTIFLDVPFEVTARRMAQRDGPSPDPQHPSMRRYIEAQRHYLAECTPRRLASLVIDNTRFADPHVRWPQG